MVRSTDFIPFAQAALRRRGLPWQGDSMGSWIQLEVFGASLEVMMVFVIRNY